MLDGMPEPLTTLKVPKALRERISRQAAAEGSTAAGLLARLLDEHDRRLRFEAVRAAYAEPDASYRDETADWDVALADGLDREDH